MINRVGTVSGINKITPAFKAENTEDINKVTIPEIKPENKGLEALAAYNEAMIKKEVPTDKMDIEPLTPILNMPADIEKMDGEKIYSADGKLQTVVRRDENTYTVFTPDEKNPGNFSLIEVFNKDSAKYPIKVQETTFENNIPYIGLSENDPKTGNNLRYTYITGDRVERASKTYYTPDGKKISVTHDFDDNDFYTYITYKNNKEREISAGFNGDKQLKYVSEYKMVKGNSVDTTVDFYNGAPYRVTRRQEYIIPNTISKEFTNGITPAERFSKIENIKEIEGEKTYYSNGALETNTFDSDTGKTTAHFLPDGSCDKINGKDKEIIFGDNFETVKETLPDGKIKETTYFSTNDYSVKISDENTYKTIKFDSNNRPLSYEEATIKDGEENSEKWLTFNEEGMLSWAYQR